ncbi:MAG TPA: tetratricopeptide repeat protein [Allosphingosinicella sp.]|jgi:tetratricopeptide (TPR) repeat protein
MAKLRYAFAALLAAASVPAVGSVIVVGNSNARMCYEAADSPTTPTLRDLRDCDAALGEEALSQHDRVATYVNRGILRLRRGHADTAIADFDAAMALNPRQPEAYLNKGAALIRLENPSEALQLFTAALEYNTERPEIAHFGRAIANEELGNIRAAYQDYRRASELDPEWQDPRTELARFRVVND